MRLFLALDINDAIRERIARFVEGVRNFAPDAAGCKPGSLARHTQIHRRTTGVRRWKNQTRHSQRLALGSRHKFDFVATDFFRQRSPPAFSGSVSSSGPQLFCSQQTAIDDTMPSLGIPKEDRPFSPHLTLARGRGASGSPRIGSKDDAPVAPSNASRKKLSALSVPEFGTMTPREFFLYQSHLSPKGSKYTKLASFSLQCKKRVPHSNIAPSATLEWD